MNVFESVSFECFLYDEKWKIILYTNDFLRSKRSLYLSKVFGSVRFCVRVTRAFGELLELISDSSVSEYEDDCRETAMVFVGCCRFRFAERCWRHRPFRWEALSQVTTEQSRRNLLLRNFLLTSLFLKDLIRRFSGITSFEFVIEKILNLKEKVETLLCDRVTRILSNY